MNTNKILVNFVALHGGGTADACQMVNALANQGCEVYAIVSKNMENINRWREIRGIHLIEVNGYTNKLNFLPRLLGFRLFNLKKIKRIVAKNQINIMYIPMISFWTIFIFKWLKKMKMRCVYTMHDVIPHDNKSNTLIWKWSKEMAQQCDDIVVLSSCYKSLVEKEYNKSCNRIHVIPLGKQEYYGDVLKKNKSSFFELVFYGRIDGYKGLDVLGKAFKILLKKHSNVHLTIAGSGDFSPYFNYYSSIDNNKITIMNRWIKDEEVGQLFAFDKTITIIPYKNATQSGVIPIAMQHKSLVISTNCSGLKEQIEDKKNGFLIEPNDADALANAIDYAIVNWDKMGQIIENAYTFISGLSWDSLANKLLREINYDYN